MIKPFLSCVVHLKGFSPTNIFLAHVLDMWCQGSTNMLQMKKKVCQGMKEVFLKDAQSTLQKTIT